MFSEIHEEWEEAAYRRGLAEGKAEREQLLEDLADMVNQHCRYAGELHAENVKLDSLALSANASAMRTLAQHGRFVIESEYGRRVIGHWPENQQGDGI